MTSENPYTVESARTLVDGLRSGNPPASAIAQAPGQKSSHQPIGRSNRASSA